MNECVLILCDLPRLPAVPGVGEPWPRLPALEYLLARARMTALAARGWREWLALRAGASHLATTGYAAAAAAARGLGAGQFWLATPVHLVAGLDTVRLHPAGLLRLTAAHAVTLAADFGRVFAGSGWQLHATGGARELLLSGPALAAVETDEPAAWLGADPKAGLPRGAGARELRRLGAEIEMWLHEHPVNHARTSAGEPVVSALWLWGGGAAAAREASASDAPVSGTRGLLYADDFYACMLWAGAGPLAGPAAASLPARWQDVAPAAMLAAGSAGRCHIVLPLAQLEEAWLAPMLDDWRAGRIHQLRLIAGQQQHLLTRAARWRAWVRTAPWWERLNA